MTKFYSYFFTVSIKLSCAITERYLRFSFFFSLNFIGSHMKKAEKCVKLKYLSFCADVSFPKWHLLLLQITVLLLEAVKPNRLFLIGCLSFSLSYASLFVEAWPSVILKQSLSHATLSNPCEEIQNLSSMLFLSNIHASSNAYALFFYLHAFYGNWKVLRVL
jgi:hypothetical protein